MGTLALKCGVQRQPTLVEVDDFCDLQDINTFKSIAVCAGCDALVEEDFIELPEIMRTSGLVREVLEEDFDYRHKVAGPIYFVSVNSEGEYVDITEELAKKYAGLFMYPILSAFDEGSGGREFLFTTGCRILNEKEDVLTLVLPSMHRRIAKVVISVSEEPTENELIVYDMAFIGHDGVTLHSVSQVPFQRLAATFESYTNLCCTIYPRTLTENGEINQSRAVFD